MGESVGRVNQLRVEHVVGSATVAGPAGVVPFVDLWFGHAHRVPGARLTETTHLLPIPVVARRRRPTRSGPDTSGRETKTIHPTGAPRAVVAGWPEVTSGAKCCAADSYTWLVSVLQPE